MTFEDTTIRRMTRDELDTPVERAAAKGRNPGLDDAEVFRHTLPHGYADIRPCRTRHNIGLLFAADAEVAERLFSAPVSRVPGEPIFLDVPENDPGALAPAERHRMNEVFGCARMVLGPVPELPEAEIYGVTTFELGWR